MEHYFKHRRTWLKGLAAGGLAPWLPTSRAAQSDWPAKPVNFIVPFAPGGPVDTAARLVTTPMAETWHQPAVIDNKAGAGGILGARLSAKAPADGYNFFFGAIHHAILPSLNDKLGYDIQKDMMPVAGIARFPIILVAHPSLGIKSVGDLIALAKEKPNSISYSSSGVGGGTHLAGALFASLAQVKLQHVPYKGSAPAVQDLVGGQVQLMFADATSALPFMQTGKVVGLGVGTRERSALAPDLPPIADALPGYEAYSWSGLFAPAGTSQAIIQRLNADVNKQLGDPETARKMHGTGSEPMAMSVAQFGEFLAAEINKWRDTIRKAGITIQV